MSFSDDSNLFSETIARLAPGTGLREGFERILRGRTGALVVLGYDDLVQSLCDGGFAINSAFAPTRLRELSKMDGGIVLSSDGSRIKRANVQFVPDHTIPTDESGTRHRTAERMALQTGYPVIAVSQSMSIVSVYVAGVRHILEDSATILSRANQTIATMERYKHRLDRVTNQLNLAEVEDYATVREVLAVLQRLEMVRRVSIGINEYVNELGTDGHQLTLQFEELLGNTISERSLTVRDYLSTQGQPTLEETQEALQQIEALSDTELLDLTALAPPLGLSSTEESMDLPVFPRGYRMLSDIPRINTVQIDRLVNAFGTLRPLVDATEADLSTVEGIGPVWSHHIRESLSHRVEANQLRF